jgi:hypothetical protein
VTKEATLAVGENRAALTILGKVLRGAASAAAKAGGNASNTGTIGTAPTIGKSAKVGIYKLRCIAAASNAGTFSVIDPNGQALADATVAVAYSGDHLNFTISDGSQDFIVGEGFDITVAAGSGYVKAAQSDAIDGSAEACAILVEAVDATSAIKKCVVYAEGEFNKDKLVAVKSGDTVETFRTSLEAAGFILRSAIKA